MLGGVPVDDPPLAPTLAVTVAAVDVLSVALAMPLPSVFATATCSSVPAVVENETGAPGSGLPLMSYTAAVMAADPP